jgi:hypothetical protein
MTDSRALGWTQLILTSLGATIAFAFGLYQYATTSSQTTRQPFLEKQTDLCFQASEAAAQLATTTDPDQWTTSWNKFWTLYWGPLAVVEDVSEEQSDPQTNLSPKNPKAAYAQNDSGQQSNSSQPPNPKADDTQNVIYKSDVATSMIAFGDLIKPIGVSPNQYGLPAKGSQQKQDQLQQSALAISTACQELVTSWWATPGIPGWFTKQRTN